MKRIKIIICIFLSIEIVGCSEKTNNESTEYVLSGQISGFDAKTWIYLIHEGILIDSTQIIKGNFSFTGNLKEPTEYSLLVKNSQDYSTIWLEPGIINFYAEKGKFKEAQVSGSKSQKEADKLYSLVKDYRNYRDSLTRIVIDSTSDDSLIIKAKEELREIEANHLNIETNFIKDNPDSYFSGYLVNFYSTTFGKGQTQRLYELLADSVKKSSYGESIRHYLELNKETEIGDRYVNFSMTNTQGKTIQLSDFEGKLILLDFWASWCRPCIQEYPALKKAYAEYKDDGFEIVSVSEDKTKDRWLNAIAENELNWINLWEESGNHSDPYLIYGINGIPDNFLIDQNGVIVARNLRGDNLISVIKEQLEKASK